MTMSEIPFSLNPVAATAGAGRSRAPVPVQTMFKPLEWVWRTGAGFVDHILAFVRAILRRIARFFNVRLESHQPAGEGNAISDASFVPSENTEAGREATVAAAAAAAQELGAFALSLLGQRPQFEQLAGDSGPAYLAIVLDELGQSMSSTAARLAVLDSGIHSQLQRASGELGVSVASLKALVEAGDFPEDSTLGQNELVKGMLVDCAEASDLRRVLVNLKVAFCDHCVVASGKAAKDEMRAVAQQKMAQFGDDAIRQAVEKANSHDGDGAKPVAEVDSGANTMQIAPKSSDNLQSNVATVGERPMAAPPPRRSRVSMQAGVVDDAVPPDESDRTPASSLRNRARG